MGKNEQTKTIKPKFSDKNGLSKTSAVQSSSTIFIFTAIAKSAKARKSSFVTKALARRENCPKLPTLKDFSGSAATVKFPNIGLQGVAPKLAKGEIASLSAPTLDVGGYFQISVSR